MEENKEQGAAQLKEGVDGNKEALETLRNELLGDDVDGVGQLDQIKAQINSLEDSLKKEMEDTKQQEAQELETAVSGLNESLSKLRDDLMGGDSGSGGELASIKAQIGALEEEVKKDLETTKKQEAQELEAAKTELHDAFYGLKSQLLGGDDEQSGGQIAEMKAQIESDIKAQDDARALDVEEKLKALQDVLSAKIEEGDSAAKEHCLDELSNRITSTETRVNEQMGSTTEQIELLNGDIEELKAKQHKGEGEQQASDEAVAKQAEDVSELKKAVEAMKDMAATNEALDALQTQVTEVSGVANGNKAACESLKEYLDANNAAAEQFSRQIEDLVKDQGDLKQQVQQGGGAELEALTSKVDGAVGLTTKLQEQMNDTGKSIEDMKTEMSAFDTFMNERTVEIEANTKGLAENKEADAATRKVADEVKNIADHLKIDVQKNMTDLQTMQDSVQSMQKKLDEFMAVENA